MVPCPPSAAFDSAQRNEAQSSAQRSAAPPFDAIVAGGGPAGSSTASFLRQRGRSVLVLERERFPRFHIGESLLPFARDLWEELGVLDEIDKRFIHKPGARFIHNESGDEFTYSFADAVRAGRPYAYEVPRGEFDELLLLHAGRLGAEVRQGAEVRDVAIGPDGVRVEGTGPDGPFVASAAVFVDATGRDTLLGSRHGLKVTDDLVATNVACFTHYEGAVRQPGPEEGNITIVLFEGGWWWLIPFRGTVTSVGCVLEKGFTTARRGLQAEALFHEALAATPSVAAILAPGRRVRDVAATGNWSYRCRQFYGERFLLVGDAAAFIDPLFSTGVLMAVSSARFAAEAIDGALRAGDLSAERFAPYQEQCLSGADLFQQLVHEFYGENLRRILIGSAVQPGLAAVITSLLAGDVYRPALWHNLVRRGFSRLIDSQRPVRGGADS